MRSEGGGGGGTEGSPDGTGPKQKGPSHSGVNLLTHSRPQSVKYHIKNHSTAKIWIVGFNIKGPV